MKMSVTVPRRCQSRKPIEPLFYYFYFAKKTIENKEFDRLVSPETDFSIQSGENVSNREKSFGSIPVSGFYGKDVRCRNLLVTGIRTMALLILSYQQ